MQLTGPLFLFLFLPLSFLPVMLLPDRMRCGVLGFVSLLWYLLANYKNPSGLLHIALFLLFALLLVYLPSPRKNARVWGVARATVGVVISLFSFTLARVLATLLPSYHYPAGLGFITLALISLVLDCTKQNAVAPRTPAELLAYLLFFPTLSVGPMIRYRHFVRITRRAKPSSALFCEGIRFYVRGFIKRIAFAAVYARTLEELFGKDNRSLSFLFLILLLSLLLTYFFISGTADLARGIAAMYGLKLPRDRTKYYHAALPHTLLYSVFASWIRFFEDYVGGAIRATLKGKAGRVLSAGVVFFLFFFFLGVRPIVILAAAPVLISSMLSACLPRRRLPLPVRIFGFLCSALAVSFISLTAFLGTTADVAAFYSSLSMTSVTPLYNVFLAVSDARYLLFLFGLVFLVLLWRAIFWGKGRIARAFPVGMMRIFETLILFVGFTITVALIMPQFPQYANSLFGNLFREVWM